MISKTPVLLAILVVILLAGCPGPQPPIAPEENITETGPAMDTCPDGSLVTDLALCEEEVKTCAGVAEDYCNGEILMHNAHCADGEWSYDSVNCAYGCVEGACADMPEQICEPENECMTGSYVDDACVDAPVEDGTPCGEAGEDMKCKDGECVKEVVVEFVSITPNDLTKLRACDGEYNHDYRYTEKDGFDKEYEMTLVRDSRSDGSAMIETKYEYFSQLVAPQYNWIMITDYMNKDCSCGSRQLVLNQKAYGSTDSGEVSMGGTCGEVPEVLSPYTRFFELADETAIHKGEFGVNFPGYVGPADEYYQEIVRDDESVLRMTYWLADIIRVPVKIVGNNTAEDGSVVDFTMTLLP